MPTIVPSSSVADVRTALLQEVQGAAYNGTTTSAGAAGGTTGIDSGLTNFEDDRFLNWWLLRDGTREYRKISDFAPSTGTLTWLVAMAAQFSGSLTYQLFKFDPSLVTKAIDLAIDTAFAAGRIYKPLTGFIVPNSPGTGERNIMALPAGFTQVWRVRYDGGGTQKVADSFSTHSGWTDVAGVSQVASGRFSFTTSADLNLAVRTTDADLRDGYVSCLTLGDTDAAFDVLCPAFRYIDSSNFLFVRLVNDGSTHEVQLMKLDGGSATELNAATFSTTSGTDYLVEVYYVGPRVQVWVNGTQYIDHLMSAANLKYLNGTNVGIVESKSGSPGTAATLDDFRAHSVQSVLMDVRDWTQDGDYLVYGERGPAPALSSTGLLYLQGGARLTKPATDTGASVGAGTLNAADATDVMEIASTDPAWKTFLRYVEGHLYLMISRPGMIDDAQEAAGYEKAAAQAFRMADAMLGMPRPLRRMKGPSL